MKTILAPVDFSSVTDGVVAEAARLARALDARVVLFTVIQPPVLSYDYAPIMENIAEITAAGEKAAARNLARLEDVLKAQSVAVESEQLIGPPTRLIVDQAEKSRADYIVMGSHGHTAFYDLLVGSTTHGVLMRAKCPVVIVPASKEKKHRERQGVGSAPAPGFTVPPPEAL
jgi:nucleotide-binding universal stress UspA family protein